MAVSAAERISQLVVIRYEHLGENEQQCTREYIKKNRILEQNKTRHVFVHIEAHGKK